MDTTIKEAIATLEKKHGEMLNGKIHKVLMSKPSNVLNKWLEDGTIETLINLMKGVGSQYTESTPVRIDGNLIIISQSLCERKSPYNKDGITIDDCEDEDEFEPISGEIMSHIAFNHETGVWSDMDENVELTGQIIDEFEKAVLNGGIPAYYSLSSGMGSYGETDYLP